MFLIGRKIKIVNGGLAFLLLFERRNRWKTLILKKDETNLEVEDGFKYEKKPIFGFFKPTTQTKKSVQENSVDNVSY
ncbi:MAG: hypothetical protein FWC10_04920 [Lentimicrobiaceae bacterium]|nr:hypothetical protein [Lentimicrobiaceae bacterium]